MTKTCSPAAETVTQIVVAPRSGPYSSDLRGQISPALSEIRAGYPMS
jgi:hypothetical protein